MNPRENPNYKTTNYSSTLYGEILTLKSLKDQSSIGMKVFNIGDFNQNEQHLAIQEASHLTCLKHLNILSCNKVQSLGYGLLVYTDPFGDFD